MSHTHHTSHHDTVHRLWIDQTTDRYAHQSLDEIAATLPLQNETEDGTNYHLFDPAQKASAETRPMQGETTLLFTPSLDFDPGSALLARYVQGALDKFNDGPISEPRARVLLVPSATNEVGDYAERCADLIKNKLGNIIISGYARMSEAQALLATASLLDAVGSLTFFQPSTPRGDVRLPLSLTDSFQLFPYIRTAVRGTGIREYERDQRVRHGYGHWLPARSFAGKIDSSVHPFAEIDQEDAARVKFTEQLEAFADQHNKTAIRVVVSEQKNHSLFPHSLLTDDAEDRLKNVSNLKFVKIRHGLAGLDLGSSAIAVIRSHKKGLDLRRDHTIANVTDAREFLRPY